MKLGPEGRGIYSTYMAATKADNTLNAVAADAEGNAYVTGDLAYLTFFAGLPPGTFLPAGLMRPRWLLQSPWIRPAMRMSPDLLGMWPSPLLVPSFSKFAGGSVEFPEPSDGFVAELNLREAPPGLSEFLGRNHAGSSPHCCARFGGPYLGLWHYAVGGFSALHRFSGRWRSFNPSRSPMLDASRFPSDTVAAALALDATGVLHAPGDAAWCRPSRPQRNLRRASSASPARRAGPSPAVSPLPN